MRHLRVYNLRPVVYVDIMLPLLDRVLAIEVISCISAFPALDLSWGCFIFC